MTEKQLGLAVIVILIGLISLPFIALFVASSLASI